MQSGSFRQSRCERSVHTWNAKHIFRFSRTSTPPPPPPNTHTHASQHTHTPPTHTPPIISSAHLHPPPPYASYHLLCTPLPPILTKGWGGGALLCGTQRRRGRARSWRLSRVHSKSQDVNTAPPATHCGEARHRHSARGNQNKLNPVTGYGMGVYVTE